MTKKVISFISALLLLIGFSFVHCDDVLDLTKNFESAIKDHDTILVKFFAPWCGHCKRLAPEYESAASKLKNNDPPVPLAKVDCTDDDGKSICSKYGVNGYPTLKVFKNGEFGFDYNGPRESEGIVKYMNSKVGPASKQFTEREKLEAALDKATGTVVLGIFEKDGASDMQTTFLKSADKLRESTQFFHVFQSDVKDVYKVPRLAALDEQIRVNSNNILVVRPKFLASKFEPNILAFPGSGDLNKFIKENSHGMVGVRSDDNMDEFKAPLIVVYYDVDYQKNAKTTNYWRNRVLKVAQNHKDVNFAISNAQTFAMELQNFGTEPSHERDAQPLVTARDEKGQKYKMEDKFSVEALENFVKNFKNGELKVYIKSEPLPEDNDEAGVKTVVGLNIRELVIESDKDVLIEFYAPWCGHCKKLAPTYEELGKALKDEPNVLIVKMDATANDVPEEFSVQGFPTIYWYPKNKSMKRYEGARELQNFIEFIAKHATEELKGYDRKGKKKESDKDEL